MKLKLRLTQSVRLSFEQRDKLEEISDYYRISPSQAIREAIELKHHRVQKQKREQLELNYKF